MKREQLIQKLHDLYFNAKDRETAVMIHLFGIKYADELKEHGSLKKIAEDAGVPASYATEISKGIKLSQFVEITSKTAL